MYGSTHYFIKFKFVFPKFKSKRNSAKSYTTNYTNGNIAVLEKAIKLPKLKAVKAVIHRNAPNGWKIKSATVSQKPSGEYYCSILYEYEAVVQNTVPDERRVIGLDYKSDGLYQDSQGHVCGSPKYYRKAQSRLAREQKKLSRKKKGSKNYEKQRQKVAKCHRHVANQRKDYTHKESLKLAEAYDIVCVENLDMRAMSNKTFRNGKATLDNGYGMFLQFLEYKLADRGKVLVKVDKFFPSSQLCSLCRTKNPKVKDLTVRMWECPACGAIHERDYNAAFNIEKEGLRIYRESKEKAA